MKARFTYYLANIALVCLLCTGFNGFAQSQANRSIAIEHHNGKIKLKVTTEEDGDKKVFEKEYASEEEMKNDPDYKEFFGEDLNVKWLDSNGGAFAFGFDHDVMIDIDNDFDHFYNLDSIDIDVDVDPGNFFFYNNGDDDDVVFQFHNGFGQNGKGNFDIKSFGMTEEMEEALEEVRERLKDLNEQFEDFNIDYHVVPKNFGGNIDIRIRKKVTIKDISEDDELASKGKKLELEDLSYYPNPNDGRFTLRFKVKEAGPIKVSIVDMAGKEVFGDSYGNFAGVFKTDIDLSDYEKGIYLMEISRGKAKTTKKIILE